MKKIIISIVVVLAALFGYMAIRDIGTSSDEGMMPNDERSSQAMESGQMAEDQNSMPEFEIEAPEDQQKNFDVIGMNFEFSLKEIRVKKGDTVRVNFLSNEGLHDWTVDEFRAGTERVGQGDASSVIFVADKAGEFEYYCSVGNHPALGMVGKLIVEE